MPDLYGNRLQNLLHVLKERFKTLTGLNNDYSGVAGLDIGNGYIRTIKINQTDSTFTVENCAFLPLPPGVIVKSEIRQPEQLVARLRELVTAAALAASRVAIAMPRSLAIVKTITIDSRLDTEEIHSRAWIEANRHFPELVGNIFLDYTVSPPQREDPARREMVLAACRKDQLNPWLEVLKQAELDVRLVDLNSCALERALLLTESPQKTDTVALLNVNLASTSLIVLNRGSAVHSHDQEFDSQRLMNQITEFVKANASLTDTELLAHAGYQTILKENLVSHLRHVMHFFYSTQSDISIQKMYLSGDCTVLAGLSEFVEKEIGIKTVLADPFRQMTFAPSIAVEAVKKQAPAFMLCCGLALNLQGET